jgi:hypothetical protein
VDSRTVLGSDPSLARAVQVIAEAFEVNDHDVVVDAIAVQCWTALRGAASDAALIRHWLQRRHDWGDSRMPYYLGYIHDVLTQGTGAKSVGG